MVMEFFQFQHMSESVCLCPSSLSWNMEIKCDELMWWGVVIGFSTGNLSPKLGLSFLNGIIMNVSICIISIHISTEPSATKFFDSPTKLLQLHLFDH